MVALLLISLFVIVDDFGKLFSKDSAPHCLASYRPRLPHGEICQDPWPSLPFQLYNETHHNNNKTFILMNNILPDFLFARIASGGNSIASFSSLAELPQHSLPPLPTSFYGYVALSNSKQSMVNF